ncbi:HPr family phosphocarrier protein [Lentisphaerota bacterium ZTH]|nr:HPr family phosphocarrier protein [Lentisphaerota bacterium]WET06113.1 HPr family phosphocarrier protein [Lentisphaerota bacterium ZTH]
MIEKNVKIHNKAGIHCRPASVILNTINDEYPDTDFTIINRNGDATELNSILNLISLGLHHNDEAVLRVEGEDEKEAAEKIAGMFEYEFDFPPRS